MDYSCGFVRASNRSDRLLAELRVTFRGRLVLDFDLLRFPGDRDDLERIYWEIGPIGPIGPITILGDSGYAWSHANFRHRHPFVGDVASGGWRHHAFVLQ